MAFPTAQRHETNIGKNYTLEELSELLTKAKLAKNESEIALRSQQINQEMLIAKYINPERSKEDLMYYIVIAPVGSEAYAKVCECILAATLRDIAAAADEKELTNISTFFTSLRCLTIKEERPISDAISDKKVSIERLSLQMKHMDDDVLLDNNINRNRTLDDGPLLDINIKRN